MSKKISKINVSKMAATIKSTVEKSYKLPEKITYDKVSYNQGEMAYIMAYAVNHPDKDIEIPVTVKNAVKPTGDYIVEQIKPGDYKDQATRLVKYIKENKQLPNFVTTKKSKLRVRIRLEIYSLAKIVVWYHNHKKYPTECMYQYTVFYKNPPVTKVEKPLEVLAYFEKVFNVTIRKMDDALSIMNNRGYAHYYNGAYTNKEAIDRIKKGLGINCTDALQLFMNIVKALISKYKAYKSVDCLHVKCSSGEGHVRGRITLNDGTKVYRDPACTLSKNSKGATCNWCTKNFTLLAVNPNWFMADLSV
ncbi:MAG: hypothetical protein IJ122_05170 [Methanobrevibacter sp.]|nr:hypothetical protein [Methanobrevibacter sp.]